MFILNVYSIPDKTSLELYNLSNGIYNDIRWGNDKISILDKICIGNPYKNGFV